LKILKSIEQAIIFQISDCFHLIYPSGEENSEITPLEQLSFIHASIETFNLFSEKSNSSNLSYLIKILNIFDSSKQDQKIDEKQLLNLILQLTQSISNNIYEISQLLIGEHQQTSIFDELKQILKSLKTKIPKEIKKLKDKYQIQNLISSYLQNTIDFSFIYLSYRKMISCFEPGVISPTMSLSDFSRLPREITSVTESCLTSIFYFLFREQPNSYDWLHSIKLINNELGSIKEMTNVFQNMQEKTLQQRMTYLIQRVVDLKHELKY
jgi:hypothetical protein